MPNQPIVGFVSPPQWYDPSPTEFAKLCGDSIRVQQTIMNLPAMQEWIEGAKAEPDEVVELDVEF